MLQAFDEKFTEGRQDDSIKVTGLLLRPSKQPPEKRAFNTNTIRSLLAAYRFARIEREGTYLIGVRTEKEPRAGAEVKIKP